jgi:uncharacterized protein (TIGR02118 family)
MVILAKRKPGMSMEAFKDYYENKHAPLGISLGSLMRRYRRTYITPVQGEMSAFGESPFDVITETEFDSEADYHTTIQGLLKNPERVEIVSKDEENLFDRPKIRWFTAEDKESVLPQGLSEKSKAAPAIKVTVLAKRKQGMSMEAFKEYYETKHAKLAMTFTPLVRRYTRTYLTQVQSEMSASGESPFDVITQAYFDSQEDYEKNGESFLGSPEIVETVSKDELNLFDRSTIWWFGAEERESVLPAK